MPRVVRFSDLTTSPWANGRGFTTEVARDPATGPFDWRISVAQVETDDAFSLLPGVDRALMAIETWPLQLDIGGHVVTLAQYDAVRFGGEEAVHPVGLEHPGLDLNLMTRRGRVAGTLVSAMVEGQRGFDIAAPARTIVLVLDGDISLEGAIPPLGRLDVAVGAPGEAFAVAGRARVAVISVTVAPPLPSERA